MHQELLETYRRIQTLPTGSENDSTSEAEDIQPLQDVDGVDELRSVIHKMPESLDIDINAYVDVDPAFPTQEELTDTEICQFVAHPRAVSQDEPEKEPPSPSKVRPPGECVATWYATSKNEADQRMQSPSGASYNKVDQLGRAATQTSITDFFKPTVRTLYGTQKDPGSTLLLRYVRENNLSQASSIELYLNSYHSILIIVFQNTNRSDISIQNCNIASYLT